MKYFKQTINKNSAKYRNWVRGHTFMTSVDVGRWGQVKNSQNSDGSGWLQGGGGEDPHKWMSRAIISISVIRAHTVFQTGVWFCYSVPDWSLVLL